MKKTKLICNVDKAVYDALVEKAYGQRISRSQIANQILAKALGIKTIPKEKKNPVGV
jgi:hypothetical protein